MYGCIDRCMASSYVHNRSIYNRFFTLYTIVFTKDSGISWLNCYTAHWCLSQCCNWTTLATNSTAETFPYATANTANDVRLDVKARGFWCKRKNAFFDVCVFYPHASSYRSLSLSSAYKHHEDAKKREYGNRVREVEHSVFRVNDILSDSMHIRTLVCTSLALSNPFILLYWDGEKGSGE